MYIAPNGQVKLMHAGIPSDYTDTIYFSNTTDQFNYFNSLPGTWLNAQSYTRVNRGVFRCSLPMREAYNIDYMMFRNQGFENKWFYAFVNKVVYTNNGLCQVFFNIDVLQTWFIPAGGQSALGECYVAREIVANDAIGANIEAESLPTGEYVFNGDLEPIDTHMSDLCVILMIVDVAGYSGTKSEGNIYNRIWSGAELWVYDFSDRNAILEKINHYTQDPDAIVGMYLAPKEFLPNNTIPAGHQVPQGISPINLTYDISGDATQDGLGHNRGINGYVPKNNKLYTYPYNMLTIICGDGQTASYRFEFFNNGKAQMCMGGNITYPVSLTCRPANYKYLHTDGSTSLSLDDKLTFKDYPMCSWSTDAYKAWLAQNSVPISYDKRTFVGQSIVKTAESVAGAAVGAYFGAAGGAVSANMAATSNNWAVAHYGDIRGKLTADQSLANAGVDLGNTGGGILSNYMGLINEINKKDYTASIAADIGRGNLTPGSATIAQSYNNFFHVRSSITAQRAKVIDDYFSMFGYAVNRLKIPDITSRPHWNFVQAVDANIKGNMPSDDRNAIKEIFTNGIRFWKNGADLGNYNLDNSPS